VTAYDAYRTAKALAEHSLDSDAVTHADMDAAADYAGAQRPADSHDRYAVRAALDAIGAQQ
jgi:hypothetical protein